MHVTGGAMLSRARSWGKVRRRAIVRWMRGLRAGMAIALAGGGFAVAIPSAPVGATQAAAVECDHTADEAHAQRLRAEVGLPNSADLVASTFSLPGYSCELAGIPLSSDEEAAFLDVLNAQ